MNSADTRRRQAGYADAATLLQQVGVEPVEVRRAQLLERNSPNARQDVQLTASQRPKLTVVWQNQTPRLLSPVTPTADSTWSETKKPTELSLDYADDDGDWGFIDYTLHRVAANGTRTALFTDRRSSGPLASGAAPVALTASQLTPGRYEWRARANDGSSFSVYSAWRAFTIEAWADHLPMSHLGGLTPSEFIDLAMEVTTISEIQAREAAEDPEIAVTVPTSVEVTDEADSADVIVTDDEGGQAITAAASSWNGRTRSTKVSFRNVMGDVLFWFKVSKYWEYNGSSVRNPATTPTGEATWVGRAGGWSYKGLLAGSSVDNYRTWNGNARGDHYSYRKGHFEACIAKVGCYSERNMWISALL